MKISRQFTVASADPFSSVKWVKRSSKISNPDGSVVFKMDDAEVPETWSQLATDIMVSKYFRKAGVPQVDAAGKPMHDENGKPLFGPEKSARQVIHRLAGCWRYWGETHGYFDTAADAQSFYDELAYMMTHQIAAPNSPQWFNTGLNFAYGITGPAQGHFVADHKNGAITQARDAYTHPQPHACFIQSVGDDLVNEGGIMDLWVREARLFKYGSGTGTNFSKLRGEDEKLSGGGKSSGLMGWLRIGDRAAGAIKSGGTTRRAAKMVCLDMDHPDILDFVNWKVREEIKVAALVEGLKNVAPEHQQTAKRLGLKLDYDFNGEAYATVSGQNSNNSVRIGDEFFDVLSKQGDWKTTYRTSGKTARTHKAEELWDAIGYAAWRCADPGVQYDSTINAWHTCPSAGRINASNPCSEYMFLDNTACNLASINLIKLYDSRQRTFDVVRYEHAVDLWTMVLEISVLMAAFPSREIAELSWKFRTLGLGYANLGAMLMQAGLAYDSQEGRALAACLGSVLTGRSYRQSALLAKEHGAFDGYAADAENMLRVVRNHRHAAHGVARESDKYEQLRIRPVPISHATLRSGRCLLTNATELLDRATECWDDALELGIAHGYRNAQTTVIAPTGTIGLLMDCDTTGVEPDFALVKFKKLAGGGYFKIANASVAPALEALGYSPSNVKDILTYLLGTLSVDVPMPSADGTVHRGGETLMSFLAGKGFGPADFEKINASLPGVFDLKFAFSAWSLSDGLLAKLGLNAEAARADQSFDIFAHLGLTAAQIDVLSDSICGRQTVENAPHLKAEHYSVFDCANPCGRHGTRFIAPEGHIRMMAAVQPFISGAISKTINLPAHATVEDCKAAYRMSWELGIKANALYRDGSKLSQPLATKVEDEASLTGSAAIKTIEKIIVKEVEKIVERIVERPMRRRLPDTRASITHKFNIAGHEGYLTVGLYEDGQPGELFITMAKEGSTIGGLMDCIGTTVSVSLQYGVPVSSLVSKFTHQRFEPAGMTNNRDIPIAKSLVDYIFRWMGIQFIPGYREANVPNREIDQSVTYPAPKLAAAGPGATVGDLMGNGNGVAPEPLPDLATRHTSRLFDVDGASNSPNGSVGNNGSAAAGSTAQFQIAMAASSGDAPACENCGALTVRNGACYKCVNCGTSAGCS